MPKITSPDTDPTTDGGQKKRLIFMLGSKGGVGKTLLMRALHYQAISRQINESVVTVKAYDTDIENPVFYYHSLHSPHPVQQLDFSKFKGGVELIDEVTKENPQIVLLDSAAASSTVMRQRFEEFGLLESAQEWGYKITIVAMIDSGHSTVESLRTMFKFCGGLVNYVVVLNSLFIEDGYDSWVQSDLRNEILEAGGVEIGLPVLDSSICKTLEGIDKDNRIPFFDYQKRFEQQAGTKLAIRSFLNRCGMQLDLAADYLGLSKC